MTAKVSCFSLLRPRHGTEKLLGAASRSFVGTPSTRRGNQRLGCQSPHFKVAEIDIDNLPFAIDDTESVPEGLEDVSVNADKSVFVDCSKAGAETSA